MNNIKPGASDWIDAASKAGVSMGGELKAADAGGRGRNADPARRWVDKDKQGDYDAGRDPEGDCGVILAASSPDWADLIASACRPGTTSPAVSNIAS